MAHAEPKQGVDQRRRNINSFSFGKEKSSNHRLHKHASYPCMSVGQSGRPRSIGVGKKAGQEVEQNADVRSLANQRSTERAMRMGYEPGMRYMET